jgi:ribosomal protein S18 acetylase RimI-like enzyme
MELEDLPPVYALGEALFTAEQWPSLHRTWDEYEPVELFSSDGEFCFVAEEDGKLVGFILGTLIEKRNSAWTYGYVLWLGVDPNRKGRGIASRLLNKLTEVFIESGARMMLFDTDAENEPALRFFKHHGFGGEVQHVYMSKNLTSLPSYQRRRSKDRSKSASGTGGAGDTNGTSGSGDSGSGRSGKSRGKSSSSGGRSQSKSKRKRSKTSQNGGGSKRSSRS